MGLAKVRGWESENLFKLSGETWSTERESLEVVQHAENFSSEWKAKCELRSYGVLND